MLNTISRVEEANNMILYIRGVYNSYKQLTYRDKKAERLEFYSIARVLELRFI